MAKKAPNKFAMLCKTEESRTLTQAILANEFGSIIKIMSPQPYLPLVKIVGLPSSDPQVILNQIFTPETKIHRSYEITTPGGYLNLIILANQQAEFINRGKIPLKTFEYCDILQCLNCQRFGHSVSLSRSQPSCKHCAENHQSSTCESTEQEQPKCINSLRKGIPLHFHTATVDQYLQRKNR